MNRDGSWFPLSPLGATPMARPGFQDKRLCCKDSRNNCRRDATVGACLATNKQSACCYFFLEHETQHPDLGLVSAWP